MIQLTFQKKNECWCPLETGPDAQNEPGAHRSFLNDSLLEFLAWGKKHLTLQIDTRPFGNADQLQLLELCEAPRGGGYYKIYPYNGRTRSKRLWLCDVPLFVFGDMPEEIYVRMQ